MMRRVGGAALTTWSLVALAAGLGMGMLGHASNSAFFPALAGAVKPFGDLWVSALQMTVLPLVVAHMLSAIIGVRTGESLGRLSARTVVLFLGLLVAAGVATVAITPLIISRYTVHQDTITALRSAVTVPDAARDAAAHSVSLAQWASGLLPRNLVQAALQGDILPLLLFTTLLGIAITRLPSAQRDPLARAAQGLAAAMLTVVRWVLWFTPPAVFALMLAVSLGAGIRSAGMLAVFTAGQSGLMLLGTALLYPLSAGLGRTSLGAFARAAAPAQLVAISTRSSLASLPALVQGGRQHLRLDDIATGFVLPLCVSVFKVNRTISSPFKLLFLAHIFGIPLTPATVVTFLLTVILLSFSSVGVPGGGVAFKTLPAYLAAGVPIEGVVILEAVDTIPDIFKTLLNVTGDMSVATLLSRAARRGVRAVTAEEESGSIAEAV